MSNEEMTFQRIDTIPVHADITTWAGVATDPDQGVVVTITNPDGTVKVDAAAMTKTATGLYVYYYNSELTDVVGWWTCKAQAQDGTGVTARYVIEIGGFYLQ